MNKNHQNQPDQRQAPRKSLHAAAVITIDGRPLSVKTVDVSLGGLCICAGKQVAVGKKCHINFEIGEGEAKRVVAASAHVVYCFYGGESGYRAGLQFTALHGDGKEVIVRYLKP